MEREVHIHSYFSLPTDLATELQVFREFLSGQEYSADLRCPASGETVTIRLIEPEDERCYVAVTGASAGPLFDTVLGRVIYALAKHSDDLMVERIS